MSITYRPKTRKRKKVHGFRVRMRRPGGRRVIVSRKRKNRRRLTP